MVLTQHTPARRPAWLLPLIVGGIALIGIIVAYFVISSSDAADSTDNNQNDDGVVDVVEQNEDDQINLSHIEQRDAEDPLAIGPVDAPVTMVVFSDYQCPFCATWSAETLPTMMDYVDDDQLRIEWRDVNVFGPESERASKAAYAAALQDSFWDYHDELYPDGDTQDTKELRQDALVDLAAELDLDTAQFVDDMHSDTVEQHTQENQHLGLYIGAYSTPAFVLNGQPLLGAQPTDVFVDAVDDALATAQD